MKSLMCALTACLFFGLTGCGGNAEKIIGTWNVVKVGDKEAPKDASMSVEFTKDGKVMFKLGDISVSESTYKVEGDKLVVTKKGKDGKEETNSIIIKNISGDTMTLHDEKKNETMELKKKS